MNRGGGDNGFRSQLAGKRALKVIYSHKNRLLTKNGLLLNDVSQGIGEGNNREGGPAGTATCAYKDCENRDSRNSPNFPVALNCGMGSSSLNAEVNAFDKLQIVRDRNSSYFASK